MPSTTNFGWTTPADTDLVKDGASAIRTLGNGIDTSLVDLKGGTTGQVLAKASNTDMDFTWSSVDPLTILDAKGDLISATAADTPARLAVGADGTYLQADSSTSTGLKWGTVSAGGMTLLNTGGTTLSSSVTTISSIPSTYNNLAIYLIAPKPATFRSTIRMYYNGDTNARYNYISANSNDGGVMNGTNMLLSSEISNASDVAIVEIKIPYYANTSTWKLCESIALNADCDNTANQDFRRYSGFYNQTTAISSVSFMPDTGNWTSGTVYVYGVK